MTYLNYLAAKGLIGNPGLEVGQKVAVKIIPLRRLDPIHVRLPFVGGTAPGQWRPTNSFIKKAIRPCRPRSRQWRCRGWATGIRSRSRDRRVFALLPPPALTSERYTRDYNEVKALGWFGSTDRTPEQTEMAYFWSENFLAQWNRALRGIAANHIHKPGERARLFALANLAFRRCVHHGVAESKKFYVFWRPLTAIVEGDNDGNPDTTGDTAWQPLLNTPNYPDLGFGARTTSPAP